MSKWDELKRLAEICNDQKYLPTDFKTLFGAPLGWVGPKILAVIAENEDLRAANIDSVDWVNSAKADIERLEADNRSKNGSMKAFGEQIAKLQRAVKNRDKQLDKLRAEVEVLRKDAERYRFMRIKAFPEIWTERKPYGGIPPLAIHIPWADDGVIHSVKGLDCDAAVDQAMRKAKDNG